MWDATIKIASIDLEFVFTPLSYENSNFSKLTSEFINTFQKYSLNEQSFELENHDNLYKYNLKFSLISNLINYNINSSRLSVLLSGIKTENDIQSVKTIILETFKILKSNRTLSSSNIKFYCHFELNGTDSFKEYVSQNCDSKSNVGFIGKIFYMEKDLSEYPCRFTIDKSLVYDQNLFLSLECGCHILNFSDDLDKVRDILIEGFSYLNIKINASI